MGIAVPSLAEASRRLPSSALPAEPVKAFDATADDVLVTSVAIAPPAIDEPVSPELALVDPELAARLRALLPVVELEPPPPLLRALPDPEPQRGLALTPPPELVDDAPVAVSSPAPAPAPVYVYPTRGDRFRSFAKAFALGAAAATVVTVGVVAELGEGPATPQEPTTTPPRVAAPTPAPKSAASGAEGAKAAKTSADNRPRSGHTAKANARQTNPKRDRAPGAGLDADKGATPKVGATAGAGAKQRDGQRQKPPAAASEPRRFAWAPVSGAVRYRLELFRGDKQVLETQTKTPVYELVSPWRHLGHTERLTSGTYRWYVWPVFSSGAAAQAVVQAKLTIP
jgi:hypothetical protein